VNICAMALHIRLPLKFPSAQGSSSGRFHSTAIVPSCLWRTHSTDTAVILIILPFQPNGLLLVNMPTNWRRTQEKASMATSELERRFMGRRLQGVERPPKAGHLGFRLLVLRLPLIDFQFVWRHVKFFRFICWVQTKRRIEGSYLSE